MIRKSIAIFILFSYLFGTQAFAVDENQILRQIEAGKNYLLRVMDPEWHAFHKRYDCLRDDSGSRLRTIYTASSLYTLLKVYRLTHDEDIARQIPGIAGFLLSMQNHEGENRGAFHYSFDTKTLKKEPRFVTGTASKTIFTMLEMFRFTQDPVYLESAKEAGQWLLRMQNADGSAAAQAVSRDEKWVNVQKFSFLYNGQVLSALSRLYRVTSDPTYYEAASKIARLVIAKAEAQHYWVGDEYRRPNPVSTSWVIMSLLDFYKAGRDRASLETILKSSNELLKHQHTDPEDPANYGRYQGSETTSGNGWICEVLGEAYNFSAEKYKNAILLGVRWLIRNTYTEENTRGFKNPAMPVGGLIRSPSEASVRTDAVCHGVNGYIGILEKLTEESKA